MDEFTATRSLAAERERTLERIASLTGNINAVAAATVDSNIDDEHDPEGSTVAFERAQLSSLLVKAQTHLADIDAALQRLAGHRYDICERCGNRIDAQRLAALPATRLCIVCATSRNSPR